jgi:hypothetical protein
MKKILLFVVLAVMLVLGARMMQEHRRTPEDAPGIKLQQTPAQEAAASADRQLLETALKSPESLHEAVKPSVSNRTESIPAALSAVTAQRSQLLSAVEKPPLPQPLKEPVAAEKLYFWKQYASLRKDEIRNPDSAENRAGVVSLMQIRQRRQKQKDL